MPVASVLTKLGRVATVVTLNEAAKCISMVRHPERSVWVPQILQTSYAIDNHACLTDRGDRHQCCWRSRAANEYNAEKCNPIMNIHCHYIMQRWWIRNWCAQNNRRKPLDSRLRASTHRTSHEPCHSLHSPNNYWRTSVMHSNAKVKVSAKV